MFVKKYKCPGPNCRDSDSDDPLRGIQEIRILQSSSCDSDMHLGFRMIMYQIVFALKQLAVFKADDIPA